MYVCVYRKQNTAYRMLGNHIKKIPEQVILSVGSIFFFFFKCVFSKFYLYFSPCLVCIFDILALKTILTLWSM